jgi:hypothetical protein
MILAIRKVVPVSSDRGRGPTQWAGGADRLNGRALSDNRNQAGE